MRKHSKQLRYNLRGRVVRKTLPGCSAVRYWYDNADRLIKMQDGVLFLPSPASYGKGQLTGTWQRAGNGEALLTIIGYDRLGFLNKKTETGLGRQLSITDFENNLAGMITSECFRKYKPNASNAMECLASGSIENNYSYPHTKLLCSSVISMYDKSQNMRTDTILHLTYDSFGNIATNNRGGTVADMTYGYDQMHGWLKSIKSGGSFEQKLYRETEGSTPCYNGYFLLTIMSIMVRFSLQNKVQWKLFRISITL